MRVAAVAVAILGCVTAAVAQPSATRTKIAVPAEQSALVAALEDARAKFGTAANELQQAAIRAARARAVCSVMRSRDVSGWIGTVERLSANGDGNGALAVAIAENVKVHTMNTAFADAGYGTLIEQSSPLFEVAASLRKGQQIRFDGTFFSDGRDCLFESSVTTSGSMREPEFVFRFRQIIPLR